MNEKLTDEYGIPKAYTMVEGLEKIENDIDQEVEVELIPYFKITANIREAVSPYIGVDRGNRLQDLLLEKEFEQAHSLLDEHWEESVRETLAEEDLEDWNPAH